LQENPNFTFLCFAYFAILYNYLYDPSQTPFTTFPEFYVPFVGGLQNTIKFVFYWIFNIWWTKPTKHDSQWDFRLTQQWTFRSQSSGMWCQVAG